MYALPGDERGVAKTAAAVSWLAVAIHVIGPIPVLSWSDLLITPLILPGFSTLPKIWEGIFKSFARSSAH